jgi:hypothetical protein
VFGKGRHHVTSASVMIVKDDFRADGLMDGGLSSSSVAGSLLWIAAVDDQSLRLGLAIVIRLTYRIG